MRKWKMVLIIILAAIAAIVIAMLMSSKHRSDPADVKEYESDNPHITEVTEVSAHRAGGGIAPEQTMMALKNCAENDEFEINVFEFDLHITKDEVLVLLHDDTLDRTSDAETVFGESEVRPEDKTYDELLQLNMGARFVNTAGETPYAELAGEEVPEELRIVRLEDALDYLMSVGDYNYIIEIKNDGDLGKKGVDILYQVVTDRELLDSVVFGTFNKEVTAYVDETYPDLARSTSIAEVLEFWLAAIFNSKSYEPPCSVLQIPFCSPYLTYGVNLGTATVINYAHEHGMAVQYWTINNPEDMKYLISMGADCIMTDYPDMLYPLVNGQ